MRSSDQQLFASFPEDAPGWMHCDESSSSSTDEPELVARLVETVERGDELRTGEAQTLRAR